MERDDTKRRRVTELAIEEKINQDLPLSADEMAYLINFFNLESLNRFCSTSWYARNFCIESQVWRKKFIKHIPNFGPNHWLASITPVQWIKYWDFLSSTRCKEQYRLLVAFLTLFQHTSSMISIQMQNRKCSVEFSLSIEFGDFEYLERIFDARLNLEKQIGFPVPMIFSSFVYQTGDEGILEDVFFEENTSPEIIETLDSLGWDYEFGEYFEEDDEMVEMSINIPLDVPHDAVTVIFDFIGFGYTMPNFEFKTITSQIKGCAACATPKPKTICGNCEQVAYCNQECADAHWEKHKCTE
jgi:hypothetical protein